MMNTHTFTVADMSCGNCVKHITAALMALDPRAQIDIHLADKRVQVRSVHTQADVIAALDAAGYGAVVPQPAGHP